MRHVVSIKYATDCLGWLCKKLMDQVCANESRSLDFYLKTYQLFFWDMVVPSLGKVLRFFVSVGFWFSCLSRLGKIKDVHKHWRLFCMINFFLGMMNEI